MTYQDFIATYNPTYKCYAVYKDESTKLIERSLILDNSFNSKTIKAPFVSIETLNRRLFLRDIIAIIVTSTKWSK